MHHRPIVAKEPADGYPLNKVFYKLAFVKNSGKGVKAFVLNATKSIAPLACLPCAGQVNPAKNEHSGHEAQSGAGFGGRDIRLTHERTRIGALPT